MSFGRLAGQLRSLCIIVTVFGEFSTIKDQQAFEAQIYNALYDFCDDEHCDKDAMLAIHPQTLAVEIKNRYFIPVGFDTYEVSEFITRNQPDEDAITDLARRYIFVR